MENMMDFIPVYDDATTQSLASEFARLEGECYVDHAGTTLYSDMQVKNVSADLHSSLYANPHSIGIASSSTKDIIERTRYRILSHFNTNPDEYSVIFTSGATAGLKLVAEGFRFKTDENTKTATSPYSGSFVYLQDNHTSVLGMRDVVAARGADVICLDHDQAFDILNQRSIPRDPNKRQSNNSLFVYSAQSNFSGLKYPLRWITDAHAGALSAFANNPLTRWYVLLDAACFVPTNVLDLSIFKPDFICLSFYKMFGYPTGIGALLVKNMSSDVLEKIYYGGGTIDVALSSERFHRKRKVLYQRFEDGTVSFLSIASLQYGFDILSKLTMDKISKQVFSLAKNLHHSLLTLHHCNDKPVVKLYSDSDYEDRSWQGGIVTFNLIRSNGEYVGYMEVVNMAALFKIHLRTGCFCNPGACQRHLSLSTKEILENYEAGYTCGGVADLINGKPTGAVRISFGYMSTIKDVQKILLMITKCFVDKPCIRKVPQWWEDHKMRKKIHKNYKHFYNSNILDYSVLYITNNEKNINNNIADNFRNESKSRNRIMNFINFSKVNTQINKCTLKRLFIYPIKSCGAYEIIDSWNLSSKGLEYDREWMIMTSSGTCLTQKHDTNLCLLKPVILRKQMIMKLTYPGMPVIEISLESSYEKLVKYPICESRVCESRVQGIDYGSEVSEWLSLALGKPNLRLIRQSHVREKKGLDKAELSFSSQAQYLAINEASVSWLMDKISDSDFEKDTAVHRFRGNIIVEGCKAFDEMQWKHICIGNNNFKVNGPCTRCQMICIDQTTGKKTIEPLRTLAEEFHGKLRFGIYLTRLENMQDTLKIGDYIYYS